LERYRVVLAGNPNTGKTTLFNALTGLRQKVANYAGVTIDVKLGSLSLESARIELVDLPGMYSLAAHSPDEAIALDVLLGLEGTGERPRAVVCVVDATNIERNLFLVSQLLEIGLPLVVALSMTDVAKKHGLRVDVEKLSQLLGVAVVPLVATSGHGLDELRQAIEHACHQAETPRRHNVIPDIRRRARTLAKEFGRSEVEAERLLVDRHGTLERRMVQQLAQQLAPQLGTDAGQSFSARLEKERDEIGHGQSLAEIEAEARYHWAESVTREVVHGADSRVRTWTDRLDAVLANPLLGTLIFLLLMALAFQAVFSWATPVMDLIDDSTTALGSWAASHLPDGALASLVSDGIIAGVGAVLVFLPQIVILFLFILVLEDSGYMARGAFMIDRLMRACGLSGQSFIPMLSSFACAVPGILATRVIPSRRDRLATVLAAPFMTCSARLPIYALLIAAFVPEGRVLGFFNLQGLVLFALYLLGLAGGITTALVLKRTLLRGPTPTFLIEMPPYRWPSLRSVLLRLWDRVRAFLTRAGTIIFAVAVVVWAMVYFPHPQSIEDSFAPQRTAAGSSLSGAELDRRLAEIDNLQAAAYLNQSLLGRTGKFIEPVFRPLGWDWRVSSAVLASLPAREVVIAALGTIYAVGDDVDETDLGLLDRLRGATWPDGSLVFSLPMALGIMVFFALCLQCGATIAAIRRESGSWSWPIFAWCYMTVLAYVGALLTYQVGSLWLS
jgi:ferrous iron transport protein B